MAVSHPSRRRAVLYPHVRPRAYLPRAFGPGGRCRRSARSRAGSAAHPALRADRTGLVAAVRGRDGARSARLSDRGLRLRSEEHTSELQSLMRISYAVFCLKKNTQTIQNYYTIREVTLTDIVRHISHN